jgi:hypothetical protein
MNKSLGDLGATPRRIVRFVGENRGYTPYLLNLDLNLGIILLCEINNLYSVCH